nr:PIN domain-containing protein [Candidatus Sigynarchaeota archaeon]
MRQRAFLDAGTIHQHFIQDPPAKIEQLFKAIERGDIEAAVPEQVLVEVYKQVCVESGKDQAALVINAIYASGDIVIKAISKDVVVEAGKLKCQYRNVLSYNDAMLIAMAIKEKATVHTTEKSMPRITGLDIVKYTFE